MSLRSIPSIVIAFLIYNAVVFASGSTEILNRALFELPMLSGGVWRFEVGDLIILLTLFLLFAELIKSTYTATSSLVDHGLSMVVFIACLVEFLVAPRRQPRPSSSSWWPRRSTSSPALPSASAWRGATSPSAAGWTERAFARTLRARNHGRSHSVAIARIACGLGRELVAVLGQLVDLLLHVGELRLELADLARLGKLCLRRALLGFRPGRRQLALPEGVHKEIACSNIAMFLRACS